MVGVAEIIEMGPDLIELWYSKIWTVIFYVLQRNWSFMSALVIGHQRHFVLGLSVCQFVCP